LIIPEETQYGIHDGVEIMAILGHDNIEVTQIYLWVLVFPNIENLPSTKKALEISSLRPYISWWAAGVSNPGPTD